MPSSAAGRCLQSQEAGPYSVRLWRLDAVVGEESLDLVFV